MLVGRVVGTAAGAEVGSAAGAANTGAAALIPLTPGCGVTRGAMKPGAAAETALDGMEACGMAAEPCWPIPGTAGMPAKEKMQSNCHCLDLSYIQQN